MADVRLRYCGLYLYVPCDPSCSHLSQTLPLRISRDRSREKLLPRAGALELLKHRIGGAFIGWGVVIEGGSPARGRWSDFVHYLVSYWETHVVISTPEMLYVKQFLVKHMGASRDIDSQVEQSC